LTPEAQVIFAIAVFIAVYVFIISEKIHRTVVAFCGAALVVVAGILTPTKALAYVDFNTIGLLTGMMIIVGITRRTGFFEYLAVKAAKSAGGEPLRILAALALVTAVLSAFLDNVTTVLLIVPVTFAISHQLKINPLPFLITEIIASNIGGTATLIGDPPNIMIGSATGLGFLDFILNLTPVIVVIYVLTIFILGFIYQKDLNCEPALKQNILSLNEQDEIKDAKLLYRCLFVLGLTILGFCVHQFLHLENSVVALSGAALLLLITKSDPEHALQAVEWPVIFFFLGLFIVVGALEKVGVIEALAKAAVDATGGSLVLTGVIVLWLSAIGSAFVDNIPFVATMIPLIQDIGRLGGIQDLSFLWWSLSLGACLGGNGTIIGASANVIVVGLAEKKGYPITYFGFFKVAFPLMLMSILVAQLFLLAWYHLHTILALVVTLSIGLVLAILVRFLNKRFLYIKPESKKKEPAESIVKKTES
jgi:Na+/H+ antiporter NhaD/arsenite permease-like protein